MPIVSRKFSGTAGMKGGVFVPKSELLGFQAKMTKLGAKAALSNYDVTARAVMMVEAEAKRLITYGYYRKAVDTGRLRMSINGQIISSTATQSEGKVGTIVYYAIYVHEGTKFMEERPFLVDALKNKQDEIKNMHVVELKRNIRSV
jgi:HK97 gp10 family phage protein